MYFERKAYLKELISAEGKRTIKISSPAFAVVVNPSFSSTSSASICLKEVLRRTISYR